MQLRGIPIRLDRRIPSNKIGLECPTVCYWLDLGENMIAKEHVDNWFMYHSPTPEQTPKYEAIREAGKHLATVILENTPGSADQSDAIRSVRNAVMTANAAIACDGK